MHRSALFYGQQFFNTYINNATDLTIIDIGSQDVNGTLRSVAPPNNNYIGLDFVDANGVDIVITDLYQLPIESESVDVVVTSSCFEHSEFFWLLFNESLRILKPTGVLYVNAPSNGMVHRYPVDCWRFYPDSGLALQNWGIRSGYNCQLLESFFGALDNIWIDSVSVFLKDKNHYNNYPKRIQNNFQNYDNQHNFIEYTNGIVF